MKRLVDTSAWIEAFRPGGDPATRQRVEEATREGDAVLCDMVLLELWLGARGPREQAVIRGLAANLETLSIDPAVWRQSQAWARRCREAGATIPATDLLIAACAAHHGADVLEHDRHFAQIAKALAKGGA